MKNPVLLIYDNNGTVLSIFEGRNTVPDGIQGIVTELPSHNFKSVRVDVSKKKPIWEIAANTENEVTNLQDALIELEERVAALEGGNN